MKRVVARTKNDYTRPIRKGETIQSISRRYGVSPRMLEKTNPGILKEGLIAGKNITIPGLDTVLLVDPVRKGDTIPQILRRLGTSESALREANSTVDWANLQAGAELNVPKDSAHVKEYRMARMMAPLSGYIENIDYLAKFNAITGALGYNK